MRIGLSLLFLLLLSGIAGTAANLLREGAARLPWTQDWSVAVEKDAELEGFPVVKTADVEKAIEAATYMFIFDARSEDHYNAGHLPTAMPLPVTEFGHRFIDYLPALTPTDRLLVYCSGAACDESLALARALRDQGYTGVDIYVDGIAGWEEAGKDME